MAAGASIRKSFAYSCLCVQLKSSFAWLVLATSGGSFPVCSISSWRLTRRYNTRVRTPHRGLLALDFRGYIQPANGLSQPRKMYLDGLCFVCYYTFLVRVRKFSDCGSLP